MGKRGRNRRGISLGTAVMLIVTCSVLAGFCTLLPKLTGNTDVRVDASQLAVAIDNSLSQLVSSAVSRAPMSTPLKPQATVLPPESLATVPPPTTAPKYRFSLCAAGNIKLNSAVQKALTDEDIYRFDILFDTMAGSMAADISIATLENNVIPSVKPSDSNLPAQALTAIRSTGINALCLGYFGALDGGIDGLVETKQSISDVGITPYGVYASGEERNQMVMLDVNGVSVALLSYQNELTSASKRKTSDEEQAFAIASQQLPTISSDIATVKQRGAQVIIVSLCWGKVGATSPTATQRELAQSVADAGADVILGTHSGTLQTVELLTANRGDGKYHPTLCAYSLGNLFTYDREKRASLASILLNTEIEYDTATGCVAFDNFSYTPTYSWRGKQDGKTRYRALLNDGVTYPDFVDKDQKAVMERCLTLVNDVMAESPIPQS